jgi:DNA-binding MarR family transcriptional regulator
MTGQDTDSREDHVDCRQAQWARELPDLDTEPMAILGRAYRLSNLVRPSIEATFAAFGLDRGEFDVIGTLRRSGPPYRLTPTELYTSLMISSGGLTHRLDRLEKAGLIRRERSERDGRSQLVALTEAGIASVNHFDYRDGVLHAEDVPVTDIAAAVGTPFYCYSTATLTRHYKVFAEAFAGLDALVCYAMKANSNQAVLKTLARLGAGADVVSEGELRRALAAGIPPQRSCFSGVGKTAREMDFALAAGIHCFNVESEPELELLVGARRGARQDRAGVAAHQPGCRRQDAQEDLHRQGGEQVRHSVAARARGLCPRAECPASRRSASTCISAARSPTCSRSTTPTSCWPNWCATLRADGHAIEHVDLGGGLGIPYTHDNNPPPLPDAYAAIVRKHVGRPRREGDLRAGPADRRQCRHPRPK